MKIDIKLLCGVSLGILLSFSGMANVAHAQVTTYTGTSGEDVFPGTLTGGSDYFGLEDYDQIDYAGASSDYIFEAQANGQVWARKSDGNFDILDSIEGIWFQGETQWYSVTNLVNMSITNPTVYQGTSADDVFDGFFSGEATFNGDGGYDQVDYEGSLSDYNFVIEANGQATAQKPSGQNDILDSIEGIWFTGEEAWYSLDSIVNQPPNQPANDFLVTSLELVSTNSNIYELRPTISNETDVNFSNIYVNIYSDTAGIEINIGQVALGSINANVELATQDTFTVKADVLTSFTPSNFQFSFDERASLTGLDTNTNGIRDDIETLIDEATQVQSAKVHLLGIAREAQIMYNATTASAANAALDQIEDYISCANEAIEPQNKSAIDSVLFELINTEARARQKFDAWDLVMTTRATTTLPNQADIDTFCANALSNN